MLTLSRLSFVLLIGALASSTAAAGAARAEIHFDNDGMEQGITPPGTTSFVVLGSSWKGGVVVEVTDEALSASSKTCWRVEGRSEVKFAMAAADVRFFFVHEHGRPPVKASAFSAEGQLLASAMSHEATTSGDPLNFVKLRSGKPIAMVLLNGGFVDDFSYVSSIDLCSNAARLCVSTGSMGTTLASVNAGGEHGGRAFLIVASFERDGANVARVRAAGVLDPYGAATAALSVDARRFGADTSVSMELLVRTPHGFARVDEPLALR